MLHRIGVFKEIQIFQSTSLQMYRRLKTSILTSIKSAYCNCNKKNMDFGLNNSPGYRNVPLCSISFQDSSKKYTNAISNFHFKTSNQCIYVPLRDPLGDPGISSEKPRVGIKIKLCLELNTAIRGCQRRAVLRLEAIFCAVFRFWPKFRTVFTEFSSGFSVPGTPLTSPPMPSIDLKLYSSSSA